VKHPLLSDDNTEFALYRKLRTWCLGEGDDARVAQCDGTGPFKKIVREVSDPQFTSITVECGTRTEAMEITIGYRTTRLDGEEYVTSNPAVMVMADGRVIRTHGDFRRAQSWVQKLDVGAPL